MILFLGSHYDIGKLYQRFSSFDRLSQQSSRLGEKRKVRIFFSDRKVDDANVFRFRPTAMAWEVRKTAGSPNKHFPPQMTGHDPARPNFALNFGHLLEANAAQTLERYDFFELFLLTFSSCVFFV